MRDKLSTGTVVCYTNEKEIFTAKILAVIKVENSTSYRLDDGRIVSSNNVVSAIVDAKLYSYPAPETEDTVVVVGLDELIVGDKVSFFYRGKEVNSFIIGFDILDNRPCYKVEYNDLSLEPNYLDNWVRPLYSIDINKITLTNQIPLKHIKLETKFEDNKSTNILKDEDIKLGDYVEVEFSGDTLAVIKDALHYEGENTKFVGKVITNDADGSVMPILVKFSCKGYTYTPWCGVTYESIKILRIIENHNEMYPAHNSCEEVENLQTYEEAEKTNKTNKTPKHYELVYHKQPFDFLRLSTENNIPFCEGNIIKYVIRHRKKRWFGRFEES